MKKICILLFLILYCGIVQAQQTSLKVCGISTSKSISSFKEQLEAKGFTADGTKRLYGTFAGMNNARIYINPYSKDELNVCEIEVSFNDESHSDAINIKMLYTAKYGKGERYLSYNSSNEYYVEEMVWQFAYGKIVLHHEYEGLRGDSIWICYYDYNNIKKDASTNGYNDI